MTYDEEEAPLDPAAERLRRKLTRLLFVSGGIMMLGLIAVFAAIVYKLGLLAPAATESVPSAVVSSASPIEAELRLPAGGRIVSTALDGDRALLTVESLQGATSLILIDLSTGEIVGRYAVAAE
jgi:hypothetical protein